MAKLPSSIARAAYIAGGIGIVQALAFGILSCTFVIKHTICAPTNVTVAPNEYLTRLIKVHYLQDEECEVDIPLETDLMSSGHFFIWLIVILVFSVVWLICSIAVILVTDPSGATYFPLIGYGWGAVTIGVVIVDVTLGVLLGLDFGHLQGILSDYEVISEDSYRVSMLGLGVMFLLLVVTKGIVLTIVNIAFAFRLIVYGNRVSQLLQKPTHSIHTRGPLNAFTSQKRLSDPWHRQSTYESPFDRSARAGSNVNRGYEYENTNSSPWRDPANDYNTGGAFDRSNSWHHTRHSPETMKPFSYIEEPPRQRNNHTPSGPTPSPNVVPPWRRDPWDQPPQVPEPDYSPINGRKLKSALKSNM